MNIITSISEFHRLLGIAPPFHPLVSVIDLTHVKVHFDEHWRKFHSHYYCIGLKKGVTCAIKYGQHYYDFDKGIMSFTAPFQIQSLEPKQMEQTNGFILLFHPDLLIKHPLANSIKRYGFFQYVVHEALHLSEKEEKNMVDLLHRINDEISHIDGHTCEIVISHIDLLLTYAKRFYNRQFITRKKVNHDMLDKFRHIVYEYLENGNPLENGLLTVQYIANELNLSPSYLSDMLRIHTGENAQQHLQHLIIDKAKELLGTTMMSVSEIAYYLGFQYPQSFNKLFKSKTQSTPLQFRSSLN